METYYYRDKNDQQQGPVFVGELIRNGVTSDTLIWKEGMNNWQAAGYLPELSAIFQTQPKRSKLEMIDNKMSMNPLFTFSNPYFEYISKGKLFNLVYIVMAVINLILPFYIIYKVIDSGFFRNAEAKFVFAFILMWFVIIFSCWVGSLLWWNRRKKVKDVVESEFIATPVFSDIIQTFGEWMGTMIGIIGAGGGLLASIFLGKDVNDLFSVIGFEFMQFGILAVVMGPVIGFIIIILFRFLAEQLRIVAALANNTKEISLNIKNNKDKTQ
jgi:hypothetical protein